LDLPESSLVRGSSAIATGRVLHASGFAIENSGIRCLEFQSLIARTTAAWSAAGTGAVHEIALIPQKDRCATTPETLTND
jgi:hypothetical protein